MYVGNHPRALAAKELIYQQLGNQMNVFEIRRDIWDAE